MSRRGNSDERSGILKWIVLGIVVVIGLLGVGIGAASWHQVPAGHVGVKTIWSEVVMSQTYAEGLRTITPIMESMYDYDTRIQLAQLKEQAAASDQQDAITEVSVNFQISPALANVVYKRIGDLNTVKTIVLKPGIDQSVKTTTAKFSSVELVTQRDKVRDGIEKRLKEYLDAVTFDQGGVSYKASLLIEVKAVAISDFAFTETYKKQVEDTARAQSKIIEEQRKVDIETAIAQQKIEKAKGEAGSIIAVAQAQANATLVKAKAEAQALKLVREQLSPIIIQKNAIDRWDGKLPVFLMDDGNGNILLDVGKFLESLGKDKETNTGQTKP
ncbi:MAG: prohibitin family protein [Candidatus Nealsonbacteria bacterium]|nr:prohibitin family protein [Candidatus Nealsonbacteria bacterium]